MTTLMSEMAIYPTWETRITLLITKKIIIPGEYLDYADVFWKDSAVELPKQTNLNENAIDLIEGK